MVNGGAAIYDAFSLFLFFSLLMVVAVVNGWTRWMDDSIGFFRFLKIKKEPRFLKKFNRFKIFIISDQSVLEKLRA